MSKIDLTKLIAAELEQLIADATQRRAQMQPAVPNEPPKQVHGVADPRWVIFKDGDSTVMLLRNPGAGWAGFSFPQNERAHILSLLLTHALTPPQAHVANVSPTTSGGGTIH